jgi:NADH dehydrogenase
MKKHIVIVGAGFGGLKLARSLNNHSEFDITLLDRNNFHQFQPLLYQVATASLDASNISFPLRSIFKKSKNITIRITELISVNTAEQTLETSTGTIHYDYLVIATGADTNYFGSEEIKEHAFPMKSTLEALQLRNQIIQNLEEASLMADNSTIKKYLTMVVVGAGPTGVELSGALAEMKHEKLPFEYPGLSMADMKIYLLEGSKKVLGNMSEASSVVSRKYLEDMGVTVLTETFVKNYDGDRVLLQDGTEIQSALVIWAAGIKGNLPQGIDIKDIAPGNRIRVDAYNKVLGFDTIFALGDIAYMESEQYPKGLPQVANVAIDQAENLAENFKNQLVEKSMKPYVYNNKGSMATVGRNKAVVDLAKPKISFQGFAAWAVWMGLHLFLLMGFKNRIVVFVNWMYKYFTRNQSLSLFFPPLLRKKKV